MTAPATTAPLQFKRRCGQSCLLKRKQLREFRKLQKNTRTFGEKQAYESHTSVKDKAFRKRKYFVKPHGNGCFHEPANLKPLIARSPYRADTGKPDRDIIIKIGKKDHDEYGNRLRTNAQYKAADKAKQYYNNPNVLPFIDVARKAMKRQKQGSNSKIGKHRSEGREGLCCTLEGLFLNMDIHSFRVGSPDIANKKVFHYATNQSIATQIGLHPKRLQRNLELLEAAGIIKMKRQWEELENGEYVGKASAIWFTRKFMKAFGMLFTFNRTSEQLTQREKNNAQRDVKTPEQIKAEATDELCQEAANIAGKKTVKRYVNDLFNFIDTDESPPGTAY